MRNSINRLAQALAVFALVAPAATGAMAEPALDRVLSNVIVANQPKCSALDIGFNLRVQYLSHFPSGSGQELRIRLRPIDAAVAAAEFISRRESLRAPATRFGRIRAIEFDASNPAGPVLSVQFDQPTRFEVSQGADFQSIVVKILGGTARAETCKAEFPRQSEIGKWSTTLHSEPHDANPQKQGARAPGRGKGSASAEQARKAAALLDEGRAALRKGKTSEASAKFKDVLALPENDSSAEAQELLALAYQRGNDRLRARTEYEDYLARYPSGEGADRVRQRLSGLVTASGDAPQVFKDKGAGAAARDDGRATWTVSGSVSQFYIRDDSFRTLRDPSLPPEVNADLDAHQVHQNELLSSLDAIATWSSGGTKSKLRFSGTEEHKFDKDDEIVGVAALFLETSVRDWGTEMRVGRQTRNTGGILGRFDGGVFSYAPNSFLRANAVVGSPVDRRRDEPFKDEKLFYGASLDIGPFDGLDFTLFGIEQRDRSILDRRAVGAEMRYFDETKSAFGMLDYDIHFNEINAAALNGSVTLPEKTNLHAAFDYRKSPYLSTWNALQGQTYPTLYEMLRLKTLAEVEQLARDRTASFTSVSAGIAHPLTSKLQLSFDVTMTNFSGTDASDAVPATAGTGNEFFYQSQLIANSLMTEEDLAIAGFRFADLDRSNLYVADVSYRYPLTDQLKVAPRLLFQYRTGKDSDLEEYSILPSLLVDYYFTRDWSLELEAGARWTSQTENGIEETTTDLFFTIGYRYDFYADGMLTSQARTMPYGLGVPK